MLEHEITVNVHSIISKARIIKWLNCLPNNTVILVDSIVGHTFAQCFDVKLHHVKIVYLCHLPLGMRQTGSFTEQKKFKELEKILLGCATFILATSQFTKQWLGEYSIDTDIMVALPIVESPSTNKHSESSVNIDKNRMTRILCVSNFLPGKGQLNLIKELSRLSHFDWTFCMVAGADFCDLDYLEKVNEVIKTANLQSRISIQMDLGGSQLHDEYGNADLFVSLTEFETYGMALAEARDFGLPVIVNDVGGVRESTNYKSTVYLSSAGTSFYDVMCNFFSNKAYMNELTLDAKKWTNNLKHKNDITHLQYVELSKKILCLL